ncbi:MAG: tRNA (N6-threonylcarbamoyladenosine(37)-N6)-methyltransferase TrmO [Candidatus Bathyarchaeia archaeon]
MSLQKAMVKFVGFVADAGENESRLVIYPEYCDALLGIESFSHIIIFYWLHKNDTDEMRKILRVTPRRHPGAPELGVFACRSPIRPNPLAFGVTKLLKVEGCSLWVEGSDAYEGTPIIDIKPYIPRADAVVDARVPSWAMKGPKT